MSIAITRVGKHILKKDGTEVSTHVDIKEAYEKASMSGAGVYTILTADEKCIVKPDVIIIDPPFNSPHDSYDSPHDSYDSPTTPPVPPDPPGPTPTNSPLWMNTDKEVYYSNPDRYLDWMKRSSDFVKYGASPDFVMRADGWLASMPAGCSILTYIVFGEQHTHVPEGDYIVFGGPATITKSLRVSNIKEPVTKPNGDITFTVPPGSGNNTAISLILQNKTANEVKDVSGIYICRVGDEEKVKSAALYSAPYYALQKFYKSQGTRTMTSTNASFPDSRHPKKPADLVNYSRSRRSYAADGGYVPFDVLAEFASDMKQDFWFSFPGLRDNCVFSFDANNNRISLWKDKDTTGVPYVHGWADGTPFYFQIQGEKYGFPNFTILYARNGVGNTLQASLTPDGPIIDILLDRAVSYEWASRWFTEDEHFALYDAIVRDQIVPAYKHTGRIFGELMNELWNAQFGNMQYCEMIGVNMAKGTNPADYQSRAGFGIAHLTLLGMKALHKYFDPKRVRMQMNSQIAWSDHLNKEWDYVDPGFVAPGKPLKAIDNIDASVATYIAPAAEGSANGNQMTIAQYVAAGAINWTDEQWKASYMRNLPQLKSWAQDFRRMLNGKNAAIRMTTYETGQHLWQDGGSGADYIALRDRFYAFLQSQAMADVIKSVVEEVHVPINIETYAQFVDLGFSMSRFLGAWGVTMHIASPMNPRAAYLASLAK